jgi:hypothetical protein
MFASKSQFCGYRPTAKDDLESFFYIIYYILNEFKLPWSAKLKLIDSTSE